MMMREKGSNGLWYRPEWDVAYCTRTFLKTLCDQFDQNTISGEWQNLFLDDLKVSNEAIGKAMVALGGYVRACESLDVDTQKAAFKKSGWLEIPIEVRSLILARLGHILMCSYFLAIREVTFEGSPRIGGQDQLQEALAKTADSLSRSEVP